MRYASERALECPVADWRTETANFYSGSDDVHFSSSHEGAPRTIPFCTTASHKSSLVAVGDEEGYVRLLDSNREFSNIHLSFQAHGNAVIDLDFSEDDNLLATASGDQMARVIDMTTKQPISILDHHTASLKQVRFQPGRGQGCVLATSGRDGSVQIWDLRCKGGPVQDMFIPFETGLHHRLPRPPTSACVVNSISNAHARNLGQTKGQPTTSGAGDVARLGEVPGRIASTPVSYTAPPPSHAAFRPFGICSLTLNGDGTRLYALCKDNTVYAYSTAHLILGHAPELTPARPGLGPLYGFRHPLFHATSFYVKAALRPAADGRSELLAVGSSDGAAVLFPTDERYLRDAWASPNQDQETYYVGAPTGSLLLPTPQPTHPAPTSDPPPP
ncbi:hypothetical protein N0V88_001166 [Collariella sp. IMI 366227]|nr:hypothetical protein N0V88_001166 [Collariella sp. IMI 366227]